MNIIICFPFSLISSFFTNLRWNRIISRSLKFISYDNIKFSMCDAYLSTVTCTILRNRVITNTIGYNLFLFSIRGKSNKIARNLFSGIWKTVQAYSHIFHRNWPIRASFDTGLVFYERRSFVNDLYHIEKYFVYSFFSTISTDEREDFGYAVPTNIYNIIFNFMTTVSDDLVCLCVCTHCCYVCLCNPFKHMIYRFFSKHINLEVIANIQSVQTRTLFD